VAGWSTSGNIHFDSGPAYYVLLTGDNENIGGGEGRDIEFPNVVSNSNTGFKKSLTEWFNTAAYVVPPFGTAGTAGRHGIYGDPETDFDTAIYKKWFLKETSDVEFRAEFFKLFNSHIFNPAGAEVGTPQYAQITGVRQTGRQIQFALKVHF
jgi:hypothetical protein